MKVREMLAKGEFNHMNQKRQADGSLLITLTKRGDEKVYKMVIKNLYQPDEEVISEEVV